MLNFANTNISWLTVVDKSVLNSATWHSYDEAQTVFVVFRAYDDLTKQCEENKEKFSDFEKADVKMREDLKHAKSKSKKLEKSVEQEKKKVYFKFSFFPIDFLAVVWFLALFCVLSKFLMI